MPATAPRKDKNAQAGPRIQRDDSTDWIKIAAGASLIAGGILLLTGQRRAGMAAAATGTTLAMLDQQDLLRTWWGQLPGYVDQIQDMIGQVQSTVEDFTARRESLRQVLTRTETPAEAKAASEA